MFQHPHGNFPSSEGLFSRGKLRLAHFLLQCRFGQFIWLYSYNSILFYISSRHHMQPEFRFIAYYFKVRFCIHTFRGPLFPSCSFSSFSHFHRNSSLPPQFLNPNGSSYFFSSSCPHSHRNSSFHRSSHLVLCLLFLTPTAHHSIFLIEPLISILGS